MPNASFQSMLEELEPMKGESPLFYFLYNATLRLRKKNPTNDQKFFVESVMSDVKEKRIRSDEDAADKAIALMYITQPNARNRNLYENQLRQYKNASIINTQKSTLKRIATNTMEKRNRRNTLKANRNKVMEIGKRVAMNAVNEVYKRQIAKEKQNEFNRAREKGKMLQNKHNRMVQQEKNLERKRSQKKSRDNAAANYFKSYIPK